MDKWSQLLAAAWHRHMSHPCQDWMISYTVCKLPHPTIYQTFLIEKTPENAKKKFKTKAMCHGALNWAYKTMKMGSFQGRRETTWSRMEPSYPDTLRWTWSSFGHSSNDPNFHRQVGVPMLGIHVRFEWSPRPYVTCDTSGHLFVFFDRENSIKCKILPKTKTAWHSALIWSYKAMQLFLVVSRISRNNVLSHGAFWPHRTPSIKHGLILDIFYISSNFANRWAFPW